MVAPQESIIPRNEEHLRRLNLETPLESLQYFFIEDTNITSDQMARSMHTYNTYPLRYSVGEWSEQSIESVHKDVFGSNDARLLETIVKMGVNSRAIVVGCATSKDAAAIELLNKNVRVIGVDLSLPLLTLGKLKVAGEDVIRLALILQELLQNKVFDSEIATALNDSWIMNIRDELLTVKLHLEELINSSPMLASLLTDPKELEKNIFNSLIKAIGIKLWNHINDHTYLIQADVRRKFARSESADVVLCLGVLSHLSTEDTFQSLVSITELLNEGSDLYANVKIDPSREKTSESGRVFVDTVLGDFRYFKTYSRFELQNLLDSLVTFFKDRYIIEYEIWGSTEDELSQHYDKDKPPYLKFRIRKLRKL